MDTTVTLGETDVELERRIVSDPKVMAGKPVIRGTRLTVDHILNRLAHGDKAEDILAEYTYLQPDDIRACLLFASRCLEDVSCLSVAAPA
jgi:uncharacterized protein (DUF433 family)